MITLRIDENFQALDATMENVIQLRHRPNLRLLLRLLHYQASLIDGKHALLTFFIGTELKGSSHSFCPDCNDAWLVLEPIFASIHSGVLVKAPVGTKESWRSQHHHYRCHPHLQLQRIPTLVSWTPTGPSSTRLVEQACACEQKVRAFLAAEGAI